MKSIWVALTALACCVNAANAQVVTSKMWTELGCTRSKQLTGVLTGYSLVKWESDRSNQRFLSKVEVLLEDMDIDHIVPLVVPIAYSADPTVGTPVRPSILSITGSSFGRIDNTQ